MAHHRFKDEDERAWVAYDVYLSDTGAIHPQLRGGWIAFESSEEKRRLAPIPAEFAKATESMLRRWCHEAETVTPPPKKA